MSASRLVTVLSVYALISPLTGCAQKKKPDSTPVASAWEAPAPGGDGNRSSAERVPSAESMLAASQPATGEAPDEILMVINGTAVKRSDMIPVLIESHGLQFIEEMILLTAARQKAMQMGLQITPAEITAAHEDALLRLQTPLVNDETRKLDRAIAEGLLTEFLAAKNISRIEWERRMEQRAYVHAIALAEVAKYSISEDDLKKEYNLAYGERVQVRHIQLSSQAAVDRATALLREKRDFELVARQLSENNITGTNGGLLPPFTRQDPNVTPLFREAAFALQEQAVSPPVREGNWFHLIKLERRFPASGVGYENVDHEVLRRRLLDRLVRLREEQLETELFKSAAVHIQDTRLDRQFREKYRTSGR